MTPSPNHQQRSLAHRPCPLRQLWRSHDSADRQGRGCGCYRYYACSANRLKGKAACAHPIAVREDELDRLVVGALADKLLTPERLPGLVREALRHRNRLSQSRARKSALQKQLRETDTQIGRLIAAVADGTLPDASLVRVKIDEFTRQRNECERLLNSLDSELPQLRQTLSRQQASSIASQLKRKLLDAPRPLQKRYVRGWI